MNKMDLKNNNKGFTLVELIVVLVILAILSAILIPALLGYIDEAKEKQYLINAKNCVNAAQAELTKLYGSQKNIPAKGYNVITGEKASGKGDTNLMNSDFSKKVFELADVDEPYCFMIALGANLEEDKKKKTTDHDKYTVLIAYYVEEEDSTQWFYYNGEWTKLAPRDKNVNGYTNSDNYIILGALKDKRVQYFLLSNKRTAKFDIPLWRWIKHEDP